MNKKINLRSVGTLLLVSILTGGLTACVEESSLNNSEVEYTPEQRALGVLAGDDGEYAPGSTVTLSGRLTGTVTSESLLWKQTSGMPIDIDDLTQAEISFVAPDVDGLEAFTFTLSVIDENGDVVVGENSEPLVDEVLATVFDPALKVRLEVENEAVATLSGAISIAAEGDEHYLSGYSGSGATTDMTPGDSITFKVNLDKASYYSLYLGYAIPGDYGGKVGQVITNGVEVDLSLSATGQWESIRVGTVSLEAGENTIEICCGWNYYRVDYVELIPAATPAVPLPVAPDLVNSNATDEAKFLMEFLTTNYSTATLTGQTEFPESTTTLAEFDKIVAATGDDAPAIVAFDYMNYSSSTTGNVNTTLTESMIATHENKNVILSALFHWRAPSGGAEFYTDRTTFDVAAALADTNSAEYAELIADIDLISAELKKLADADIPVLWRPLHEAQGGWFWWGAKGSTALKDLWVIMYDRMTNVHGLNNLIWVFTHSSDLSEDWYPGDSYVDIVGYDGYASPANDASATFSGQYATLKSRHDGKKIIALTETGTIPDVANMHDQDAWWSFFITWNSETWNSSSVIGPDGADSSTIANNYAGAGVLNLDSVPGGRDKVEAGIYEDFEPTAINGWEAQINWSPVDGLKTSSNWAESGSTALALAKNMTELVTPENIVFQTYPEGGLDVSNATSITFYANALNAGTPNVHVFVKHADGESWPDPIDIAAGGVAFTVDISDVDNLTGFGARFQNLDATATNAEYLIDKVVLTDAEGVETIAYDFEPSSDNWSSQISWSATTGITTSDVWSSTGARSLGLYKDLSAEESASDIVFQTYPQDGIDVTDKSTLTLVVNAIDAGNDVNAHIFFKAPDGVESWPDAINLVDGGTELAIDVSEVNTLNGLGVRFNGVDASSTDAKFLVDNVQVDGATIYDFEGTGSWEFQNNWSPVKGVQLAQNWQANGANSLVGITQLVEGDDNVILQVYPQGGILLGDVTMLKVVAHVMDAGADVQVQLFAKDQDLAWRDSGAVDMVDGGVELLLDISDLKELSGFGVRFMSPSNIATPAKFYIDKVEFE